MSIIDADGHIVEKDVDIRKYLPEPYLSAAGHFCRRMVWTRAWVDASAVWKATIFRHG
jgi:hypothetical protein